MFFICWNNFFAPVYLFVFAAIKIYDHPELVCREVDIDCYLLKSFASFHFSCHFQLHVKYEFTIQQILFAPACYLLKMWSMSCLSVSYVCIFAHTKWGTVVICVINKNIPDCQIFLKTNRNSFPETIPSWKVLELSNECLWKHNV